MQPFFFVSHPSALCAYEFGISDNITEFLKIIGNIALLPLAKRFGLFSHFVFPYEYYRCIRVSIDIESFIFLD